MYRKADCRRFRRLRLPRSRQRHFLTNLLEFGVTSVATWHASSSRQYFRIVLTSSCLHSLSLPCLASGSRESLSVDVGAMQFAS
jgi:hypothetical protein